ncbi:MAG: hypothetical protein QMC36_08550 [Patescibacteria group bacterium]
MHSNVKIFAASTLALSLLLASCGKGEEAQVTAPVPKPAQSSKDDAQPKPPEKPRTLDEVLNALPSDVKDSNVFRICAARAVESCENMAVTEEAKTKSDISLCDKMKSEENRESCKSSLIAEEVRKSGDASKCEILKAGKEDCVKNAVVASALKSGDPSKCDALKPKDGGPRIDDNVDMCVIQVVQATAKSAEDEKKCAKIQSEAIKTSCETFVRTKQYDR